MSKKCDHKDCNLKAEYTVTTASGKKKYLCKKHGRDIMKTLASMKEARK